MIVEFDTESGSTYQVDPEACRMRRLERSAASSSERAGAGEWRQCAAIVGPTVGFSCVFQWGTGRDEHSATAEQTGTDAAPDELVVRMTTTTPVTVVREVASS